MKNGKYILVIAPKNYPGKKYRNKYCHEHTLIYWLNTGIIPKDDEEIHHKNEDGHDNRFENLELLTSKKHKELHSEKRKIRVEVMCGQCKIIFSLRPNKYRSRLKNSKSKLLFCKRSCQVKYQQRKDIHGNKY